MAYTTRVQLIRRKSSRQWYVGFPTALAEALDLEKGELIEWKIEDKRKLVLLRKGVPARRTRRAARTPRSEPTLPA
ncbi:MAG: hypothetical protein HY509_05640 [Acidobacteria bacterium]|nr:hypothetical protein [Acidobacteriota bacterium]